MNAYTTGGYGIFWNFPSATERIASVALSSEVDKIARQRSDNTLWICTGANPTTWAGVTQATGSAPASYTASFSAAASWTVNHNLGYEPNMSVLSVGGSELVAEIVHTSINQCIVYFAAATAGRVRAF